MASSEYGEVPGRGRDLNTEVSANCDKCNQPVNPGNDATILDTYTFGGLTSFYYRARHLLPTEVCQGSPSRAQYLEGQPRDQRGYKYNPKVEPLYRAVYALMQVKFTENRALPEETVNFLLDHIGQGVELVWRKQELRAREYKKDEELKKQASSELRGERPTKLAATVAAWMGSRGWNQTLLAQASGCDLATIGRIVHGQTTEPRLHNLRRIAEAFGISVDELVIGRLPDTSSVSES